MTSVQVSERRFVGTIASYRLEYLAASGRCGTRADVIRLMCSPALEQFQYRVRCVIDWNHVAGRVRIAEEHSEMFQGSDDPCDIKRARHHRSSIADENGWPNYQQLVVRNDSTNGDFREHFGSRVAHK